MLGYYFTFWYYSMQIWCKNREGKELPLSAYSNLYSGPLSNGNKGNGCYYFWTPPGSGEPSMGPPGALQGPQRWPRIGSVMDPGGRCGRCLRRREEWRNNQRKWTHGCPARDPARATTGTQGPQGGSRKGTNGGPRKGPKEQSLRRIKKPLRFSRLPAIHNHYTTCANKIAWHKMVAGCFLLYQILKIRSFSESTQKKRTD